MTIRVLVVDDSPTMRQLIAARLRADPGITVVGFAGNPNEARKAVKELDPDVMTLDIEMPEMDGIAFLDKIMRLRPMPVVMVSTLTGAGAAMTTEALALGAFDCVGKLVVDSPWGLQSLVPKVRAAAQAAGTIRDRRLAARAAGPAMPSYRSNGNLVVIGASTGGVEVLSEVLAALPAACPPTVVVQHMPGSFTGRFAARLDKLCAPHVEEAHDGATLEIGKILIAPGGVGHTIVDDRNQCRITPDAPVGGFRPSIDMLFRSVAKSHGRRALGVIMTGMGRDGAEGLLAMRTAGARTLGQDRATAVVYGMPRVAYEIGAVETQLPTCKLAEQILALTMQPAFA